MTKGSSLLVIMNMKYLRNHNEEVMKEIWEDHSTGADLPPHDVSVDPGDRSGRYKSLSQGTLHLEMLYVSSYPRHYFHRWGNYMCTQNYFLNFSDK